MPGNNRLTKEQLNALRANYGVVPLSDFSEEIGRLSTQINALTEKVNDILHLIAQVPRYNTNWADEDIAYLKENYKKETIEDIAKHTGRSKNSIFNQALRLGLKKRGSGLNDEQKKFIEKNYNGMNMPKMSEHLDVPVTTINSYILKERKTQGKFPRKNKKAKE